MDRKKLDAVITCDEPVVESHIRFTVGVSVYTQSSKREWSSRWWDAICGSQQKSFALICVAQIKRGHGLVEKEDITTHNHSSECNCTQWSQSQIIVLMTVIAKITVFISITDCARLVFFEPCPNCFWNQYKGRGVYTYSSKWWNREDDVSILSASIWRCSFIISFNTLCWRCGRWPARSFVLVFSFAPLPPRRFWRYRPSGRAQEQRGGYASDPATHPAFDLEENDHHEK